MWAHEQIFDSGNIFRLWSKCILYCFKNLDKLPDHYYTHKTSLHQIWHHFIDPFNHHNYSKFLVSRDVCEASAILACPFSMIFLKHINMSKLSSFAKFELKLTLHVSAPSWSSFWTKNAVVKQLYSFLVHFSSNLPGWKYFFTSTLQTTPFLPKRFLLITSSHPSLLQ